VGEGVIGMLTSDHAIVTQRMHTRLEAQTAVLQDELVGLIAEAEAMKTGCNGLSGGEPPAESASRPTLDTASPPPAPTPPGGLQ
jgi:hypothetical protein